MWRSSSDLTPKGAVPGDLPGEDEKEAAITDLRLRLGVTGKTVVERGLQICSLEQGRPVPLAEAVEMLFAKLVEKDGTPSADLDALAQSQQEARKDLLADEHRRQPLVQEARALAQRMGLTVEAEECQGLGGAGDSSSGRTSRERVLAGYEKDGDSVGGVSRAGNIE